MVEEAPREAHLPAQQASPRQAARLSPPDGHPGGAQRPAVPPPQGAPPTLGLIWRIRDRRTFAELRRRGRRARHGVVSVTHLRAAGADVALPPRVAFAVPRKVGTAVVRNRLRRQVRAHLSARAASSALAPGAYLVHLAPPAAEVGRAALVDDLDRCLERLAPTTP
jgi:ribonuclease P protein component